MNSCRLLICGLFLLWTFLSPVLGTTQTSVHGTIFKYPSEFFNETKLYIALDCDCLCTNLQVSNVLTNVSKSQRVVSTIILMRGTPLGATDVTMNQIMSWEWSLEPMMTVAQPG